MIVISARLSSFHVSSVAIFIVSSVAIFDVSSVAIFNWCYIGSVIGGIVVNSFMYSILDRRYFISLFLRFIMPCRCLLFSSATLCSSIISKFIKPFGFSHGQAWIVIAISSRLNLYLLFLAYLSIDLAVEFV